MFNIGDYVWIVNVGNKEKYITCPDCQGSGFLTCIMGDGSQITFDCQCCREGFEGSHGKIRTWEWSAVPEKIKITGIESKLGIKGNIEYHYRSDCYGFDTVYATEQEAQLACIEKTKEHIADEKDRLENQKEQAHKSWAFHVSYHRRLIKDLEKQLAYHKEKLAIAESKKYNIRRNSNDYS